MTSTEWKTILRIAASNLAHHIEEVFSLINLDCNITVKEALNTKKLEVIDYPVYHQKRGAFSGEEDYEPD